MIAYLIMMHRYPNQFKRLFRAIYHPDNCYIIHIDEKSESNIKAELTKFLTDYPNVSLLKSEKAIWGGYSLVDIELRGIAELLEKSNKWQFFINLSGQDFPLKSQEYIFNFLKENRDTDFLKVSDQAKLRPNTLHRIENYFIETDDHVIATNATTNKREFLKDATPYIGNQWMILTRKFCKFVTHNKEVKRFKEFYKNTLISDESFFQTVIMNTSYKNNLANTDKRFIDWIPMGTIKLRPRDLITKDAKSLTNSKNLFARKFDENTDSAILGILEQHIANTVVA